MNVLKKALKKAFRNKVNFDEFVDDVIDKMKGDNMRAVKMQIVSYSMEHNRTYVTISVTCPMCGRESLVKMSLEQFNKWNRNCGELVQIIFPEKTSSEREVLISGICSTCWDKMFS